MIRRSFLLQIPWIFHDKQRCPLGHSGSTEYGSLVVAQPNRRADHDGDPISTIIPNQRIFICNKCGILFAIKQ